MLCNFRKVPLNCTTIPRVFWILRRTANWILYRSNQFLSLTSNNELKKTTLEFSFPCQSCSCDQKNPVPLLFLKCRPLHPINMIHLCIFVLWLYCMSFGLGIATNQNVRIKAFFCISDFSLIILKIQNGNGVFTLLLYITSPS